MVDWDTRPASAADVEAVAELRAVVLRADLERLGRYDEQRVRQRLRDGFDPACTRVIEVGGAFAGCVALRPAGDAHWLEHFYLAPHVQGSGIGSGVLRSLLERCDRDGVLVRLNVLRGSPARRLYERHGFTLESEDPVDVFMVREPSREQRNSRAGQGVPSSQATERPGGGVPLRMKLTAVTLDCPDPPALAAFYQQATGLEPHPKSDADFAGLNSEDGLFLGFQRVDDYRAPRWPDQTVPQQFHLDFAVEDLDEAETRLLELGAVKPEHQPGGDRWRVFTDPAGHPFCVVKG